MRKDSNEEWPKAGRSIDQKRDIRESKWTEQNSNHPNMSALVQVVDRNGRQIVTADIQNAKSIPRVKTTGYQGCFFMVD